MNRFAAFAFASSLALGSASAWGQTNRKPKPSATPTEASASIRVPEEWVSYSSTDIDSSRELPLRESHSLRIGAVFLGGSSVVTSTYLPNAEAFGHSAVPALSVSYRSPGFLASQRLAGVVETGLEWRRRSATLTLNSSSQTAQQDLYRLPLLAGLEWSFYVTPAGDFEVSAQLLAGLVAQTTSRSALGPESRSQAFRWKSELHVAYRPKLLPRGVLVHAALLGGSDATSPPASFFGLRTGLSTVF